MTIVATYGPTPVACDSVVPPMRHRNFRLDDTTWQDASRIAELRGERISDVMRTLVKAYVTRHRKLLDKDRATQQPSAPDEQA